MMINQKEQKNKIQVSQKNHKDQLLSFDQQAIVAQCTPQGSGALAIIRLSGDNAVVVADQFAALPSGKKLADQKSHTIHYGWVIDQQGNHVDQVLFLLMKAPRTFTGQDVVEISCHNNQFLIEAIIDRALACGARLAQRGEFAQRSVMSGKIDLVQAEAINDLIHAQTSSSLQYSLQQLEGSLSSWIAQLEQQVLKMLAFCEASFEFIDEEEMEFVHDITGQLQEATDHVENLLATVPKQQYIKEGIRIALVGCVNAGKSSLFNALLAKERAIVTDIAGTTRDTIESTICRHGDFLTFVDTAGLRETENIVEQQGIDRSFAEVDQADIILLTFDGSKKYSAQELQAYTKILKDYGHKVIVVRNKIDLAQGDMFPLQGIEMLSVSAYKNQNIAILFQAVDAKVAQLKGSEQITCLLNKRQHTLLVTFLQHLNRIRPMLTGPVDYELVSFHLQEALQTLAELTGRAVSEATMDQVFQQFCVGK